MALCSMTHRSSFAGTQLSHARMLAPCIPRVTFTVESAQKKGAGSTKNGRDSISKRRGTKVYGGQPVKAGGIIVRQVGSTWYPGENVGLGKDYTLFSKIPGIVVFEKNRRDHQQVSVYPFEHEKAVANVALTHTTAPKEGVPSRKERRKTLYKPRALVRAEAEVATAAAAVPASE